MDYTKVYNLRLSILNLDYPKQWDIVRKKQEGEYLNISVKSANKDIGFMCCLSNCLNKEEAEFFKLQRELFYSKENYDYIEGLKEC